MRALAPPGWPELETFHGPAWQERCPRRTQCTRVDVGGLTRLTQAPPQQRPRPEPTLPRGSGGRGRRLHASAREARQSPSLRTPRASAIRAGRQRLQERSASTEPNQPTNQPHGKEEGERHGSPTPRSAGRPAAQGLAAQRNPLHRDGVARPLEARWPGGQEAKRPHKASPKIFLPPKPLRDLGAMKISWAVLPHSPT